MKPISEIPQETCRRLRGVFFDIDDTLTSDGRIPPEAFVALHRLGRAGLWAVPVTGRPAGWCDHIARMWPVDAVVGENGAFYFALGPAGMRRRYVQDEQTRASSRRRLEQLRARILSEVAEVRVAADQGYRESDLAIDFREDVPFAGQAAIDRVVEIFHSEGARAKVSSIHVNGWFGDFDKLTTSKLLVSERFGGNLEDDRAEYLYIGDSPNDEPAFAFFPNSIGVANVSAFLPRLAHPPSYVAQAEGGLGFAEIVETVLTSRRS